MIWQPLTSSDVPAFVECLEKYPLSMSDEIRQFPMQYYTLRVNSPDAIYVKIPELCYLALDPIGSHDALFHPVRDPLYRQTKKVFLDSVKSFMLWAFEEYGLKRLTLCVNEGSYLGKYPFDKYAKLGGFEHEGTIRKSNLINGNLVDVHIFGIVKE